MNVYEEMEARHLKEVNDFPMFFAFNDRQFEEGMKKFGFNPSETDKIYKLGDSGGFYRRSDSNELKEMFVRQEQEMKQAIKNDKSGDENGFIYNMFNTELANHEYIITGDIDDTLNALGLTIE